MTIARFEVFTKIVELGSFTRAADQLNMTQSAVSHAIASLESEWGVSLFIRDRKKGVLLTEIGQMALPHMREILNRMEKINQEVALASKIEVGTIRIGTFASASACLLPKILSKFQKRHPKIEFKFYEGTYEEITEWLKTGVVDIGFVVEHKSQAEFEMIPIKKDKMVVAFSVHHKFNGQENISIQDLKEEPFIMPTGMYQSHVNEIFQEAKLKPCVRFEVHDCNTIANMVKEGLGVTIGPELFLKSQPNIRVGNLNVSNWRNVALACHSISDASPAVKAFLAVAKSVFGDEA
ncbi:LysR family transcriptional regulator [Brevibacillus sp. Leaf182]|uniref:LysR family transcriptional regulator n=1 Tax=Brevibacillus sp. Leaf182 TaxID=1736290 RepID=UPI0006F46456|nr:LysR family transcriptional regulator [Brevibacillus sp. Leaf182]RAT97600.1 LysR family transcriptional regulator [Brevibacillus sp. Leaf182]